MLVCDCNALQEKVIRKKAGEMPGVSVEELFAGLGVTVNCGSCRVWVQQIQREEARRTEASTKPR